MGTWAVGAMTDTTARRLPIQLDFLDAGTRYRAEIYRDGEGADWKGDARFHFVREERMVRKGDEIRLALAPGGGAAILLVPMQ